MAEQGIGDDVGINLMVWNTDPVMVEKMTRVTQMIKKGPVDTTTEEKRWLVDALTDVLAYTQRIPHYPDREDNIERLTHFLGIAKALVLLEEYEADKASHNWDEVGRAIVTTLTNGRY